MSEEISLRLDLEETTCHEEYKADIFIPLHRCVPKTMYRPGKELEQLKNEELSSHPLS
jgi:hypothetical protein